MAESERTAACSECGRAILKATAKATGGICRPCLNRKQAKAAQEKWAPIARAMAAPMTASEFDSAMATDADDAIQFIYEKADFKRAERGVDTLSTGERTVLAVQGFFDQACNGGLEQFLDSEAGDFAQELPRALARVGLKKYVRHFFSDMSRRTRRRTRVRSGRGP